VHFHQFFYVLDPNPGEVDTDIRRGCLNIGQIFAKALLRGAIIGFVINKSSHPDGESHVLL